MRGFALADAAAFTTDPHPQHPALRPARPHRQNQAAAIRISARLLGRSMGGRRYAVPCSKPLSSVHNRSHQNRWERTWISADADIAPNTAKIAILWRFWKVEIRDKWRSGRDSNYSDNNLYYNSYVIDVIENAPCNAPTLLITWRTKVVAARLASRSAVAGGNRRTKPALAFQENPATKLVGVNVT